MNPQERPSLNPTIQADLGEIVNFTVVTNWLRYFAYQGWQRKWVIVTCGIAFATLVGAWVFTGGREYATSTTLVVVKNSYVQPRGEDRGVSMTEGAARVLPSRANLEEIVKRADLIAADVRNRSLREKLVNWLLSPLAKPVDPEDALYFTVRGLEEALSVEADRASITLSAKWNNEDSVFRIVAAARELFLEICHERDVSAIIETISILERQAADLRTRLDRTKNEFSSYMDEYIATKEKSYQATVDEALEEERLRIAKLRQQRPVAPSSPFVAEAEQAAARLSELDGLIATKEQSLQSLGSQQQTRLATLHGKLAELRTRYTDAHPAVIDVKQQIAAASAESPRLQELAAELSALRQERSGLVLNAPKASRGTGPAPEPRSNLNIRPPSAPDLRIASQIDPEYGRLEGAVILADAQYASLQKEIAARRLDLELAQRAFKLRYQTVVNAEVPRKATKPRVPKVLGAFLGGLFFGFGAIAIFALRRGVLDRTWQLEQLLPVPVVGSLALPSPTDSDES